MNIFKRAEKAKSKLRLAIYGPSGSGKTMSSLLIAQGLGGKIALIDTERKSASKYSDRVEFDVLELERRTIEDYIQGIDAAGQAGYQVLIIDSLSHAWAELVEEIYRLADNPKYKGNSFRAWAQGTPKQKRFVDAILKFPGHIIGTMRSATEWAVEVNQQGKPQPRKLGLKPEQGKGIEYEFDLLMAISPEHWVTVEKDRTGKYQDQQIDRPGVAFGRELAQWLESGVEVQPVQRPSTPPKPVEPASDTPEPEKAATEAPEPVADIDAPASAKSHRAVSGALKLAGYTGQRSVLDAINKSLQTNYLDCKALQGHTGGLTEAQAQSLIARYETIARLRHELRKAGATGPQDQGAAITAACTVAGLVALVQPVCLETCPQVALEDILKAARNV